MMSSTLTRQPLQVQNKFSNPFDGMFSGNKGGDSDAARRAIERSLGKGKQPPGGAGSSKQQPSKGGSSTPGRSGFPGAGGSTGSSGGGFGGLGDLFKKGSADKAAGGFGAGFGAGAGGSSGGGGGGGGWNWGGQGGSEGEEGPEKPIKQELLELAKGMWVLFWNAALFLAFADILHRSLDWCCQIELLLLIGAPKQAWERIASRWYNMVEWIEVNCLGWKLPREADTMPMYKQIALFYPEEHAYTFDSYRYNMNEAEKTAFRRYYALRWWERDGGFAGDVTAEEIQKIRDKYTPAAVDLREYQKAKAEARLDEYWASKGDLLKELTGSSAPPVVAAS